MASRAVRVGRFRQSGSVRGVGMKFGWAAVAALGVGSVMACGSAQAHHNDWAAPLVGGALGGYALGSIVSDENHKSTTYVEEPAPVYYTPPPAPTYVAPLPSTATIEARLKQLDALAAGGYITPQEYQTRRTQILNGA